MTDNFPQADDLAAPDDSAAPDPEAPSVVADARRAIEAVLMVADEPVQPQLLAQLVELPVPQVEAL